MGRAPCCNKNEVKRGAWSAEEDALLRSYLDARHGCPGNWISLPRKAGLNRCGKSCRLRWLNYLRPNIKRGGFTHQEDNIILSLYSKIGSKWSVIAENLPGRTDNDVKNHWNTKLKKKQLDLATHHPPNPAVKLEEADYNYTNNQNHAPPCSFTSLLMQPLPAFPPSTTLPDSFFSCFTFPFHATTNLVHDDDAGLGFQSTFFPSF